MGFRASGIWCKLLGSQKKYMLAQSQENDTSTYFFNELTLKKHVGLVQSKFYHHLIEE